MIGGALLSFPLLVLTSMSNDMCPDLPRGEISAEQLDTFRKSLISMDAKTAINKLDSCFPSGVGDNLPSCLKEASAYFNRQVFFPGSSQRQDIASQSENMGRYFDTEKDLPDEFLSRAEGSLTGIKIPPDLYDVIAKKKEEGGKSNECWEIGSYRTRSSGGFDFHRRNSTLTIVTFPSKRNPDKCIAMQFSPLTIELPEEVSQIEHTTGEPGVVDGVARINTLSQGNTLTIISGQAMLKTGLYGGVYSKPRRVQAEDCKSCHTRPFREISPRGCNQLNTVSNGKKELPMGQAGCKTIERINRLMRPQEMGWQWFTQTVGGKERIGNLAPDMDALRGRKPPYGWVPIELYAKVLTDDFVLKRCAGAIDKISGVRVKSTPEVNQLSFSHSTIASIKSSYHTRITTDVAWKNTEIEIRKRLAAAGGNRSGKMSKIVEGMVCSACHNGRNQAFLHNDLGRSEISFKMFVDGSMPDMSESFGDTTPPEFLEKMVIRRCLDEIRKDPRIIEAWNKQKPWLTVKTCEAIGGGTAEGAGGDF